MNYQSKSGKILFSAILILLFQLVSTSAFSQFRIGLKAVSPTISAKESLREYWEPAELNNYGLTYVSTQSSFGFGLSFYQENSKLFIMSDVIYKESKSNYRIELLNSIERESNKVQDKHQIISVPIIAGVKYKNIRAGLGPVFNFKIDSEFGLAEYSGFNMQNRTVNKGVQFVVGMNFKEHFYFDLRHEISFDSEGDDYNIVGSPLKIHSHPQSFSVSVGFYL